MISAVVLSVLSFPSIAGMRFFHHDVLLVLNAISLVSGLHIAASPLSQLPFLTVWNAPTASCLSQYGVDLDLGTFSIVQNQNQTFMGENITIFYSEKLGLYPRYSSHGEAVNGGVPQNASLDEHLRAASDDIRTYIPDRDFQGLAVVDWESWRPVWERNWDSKQVYWEGSRALVRSRHPDWSPAQVEAAARAEFEDAGRKFMEETVKLGQEERPNGLWGFYGFPNCYNYYSDKSTNYTGECPAAELKRNNELFWLWNASSALYPDIYLSLELRGLGREVLLYTHHRILEAMRAGAQVTPSMPPVFPYARIVYTYTLDFLSQARSRCFVTAGSYWIVTFLSESSAYLLFFPPAGAPGLHPRRECCFRICRVSALGRSRLLKISGTPNTTMLD